MNTHAFKFTALAKTEGQKVVQREAEINRANREIAIRLQVEADEAQLIRAWDRRIEIEALKGEIAFGLDAQEIVACTERLRALNAEISPKVRLPKRPPISVDKLRAMCLELCLPDVYTSCEDIHLCIQMQCPDVGISAVRSTLSALTDEGVLVSRHGRYGGYRRIEG